MTPAEQAILDQMTTSQRIEEYRRRAGELSAAELAVAVNLIRKERASASASRTAKKSNVKARAGASVDDMFASLDALKGT